MVNLNKLDLLPTYHKGQHDIAEDFYLPCMSHAVQYDRAVGFFSSAIYVIAWSSLKDFVFRGGKIRIICSPAITEDDASAIEKGYEARLRASTRELLDEVKELFNNPYFSKPARVLGALVASEVIDIKLAFLKEKVNPRHKRIFHDKVGIFKDKDGNSVVFKGSMNETWAGLSNDGNIESVDVYVNWCDERDRIRVEEEERYFEALWDNQHAATEVIPFPEIVREEIIKGANIEEWPELVDEICAEITAKERLSADKKPGGRTPRPHQVNALKNWFQNNRKGIFEHATGSGKTFTALCAIRDALSRGETPLILVPSDLLLKQWFKELKGIFEDLNPQILQCGGGNNRWKENDLLVAWSKKSEKPRIILATMQTASKDEFLGGIRQGEHIFLVADEVHRLGSPQNRKIFLLESGPRLGLSATPRRAGDLEGTNEILAYFDGIIPPPFTLKDAIASKALTPYMYYVHSVSLTDLEQEQWNEITKTIQQLYARSVNNKGKNLSNMKGSSESKIKQLLINRARIVKSAGQKVKLASHILRTHYLEGQRWIVYCDSQSQLYEVLNELRRYGINAMEYHTAMQGDSQQTLRYFDINGGVIVSIKCLDEGVDIPSVTHALILASSKNPREFVQRRGRVLRRARDKNMAFIHDVIVKPYLQDNLEQKSVSIIENEIARAIEFGEGAENPSSIYELKRILVGFGLDYKDIANGGYEGDEQL